jgi:glycosidase
LRERRPQVETFYKALAALRHSHPALTHGAVRWLRNSDERRVLSYERTAKAESLMVVINLSSQSYTGLVEIDSGKYQDITPVSTAGKRRTVALPAVFLESWEYRIFSRVVP